MIPLALMCDICTSPKNVTDTRGEMGPLGFELTTKLSVGFREQFTYSNVTVLIDLFI